MKSKRKRIRVKVSELLKNIEAKNKGVELIIYTSEVGEKLIKEYFKGTFHDGKNVNIKKQI